MASIRAHLLNWMLRLLVKSQLGRVRTPLEARAAMNRGASWPNPRARYTPGTLGGIAGEWVESRGSASGALLYLHGGAYIAMSPRTHRAITGAFAAQGFRVFAPDYRLAPEHPFPAALDDAMAAYATLAQTLSGPLFVAGDSAGGGLALALLMQLRDQGRQLPDGAVLLSPWTDLAGTGESLRTNRDRDPMFDPDRIAETGSFYAGAADPRSPFVSPLYGAMRGLPPLCIFVGDREVLLEDSRRVAIKARDAGVRVDLHVWPVVPHVWQLFAPFIPEAGRALTIAGMFLRNCRT